MKFSNKIFKDFHYIFKKLKLCLYEHTKNVLKWKKLFFCVQKYNLALQICDI